MGSRRVPRSVVAAALVVSALAAAPAGAVPPVTISGSGTVSPGISPCCAYPVAVSFTGTGESLGSTYACAFQGYGTYGPPTAIGTMEGACGPLVYSGCLFTLDLASLKVACPTSVGSFVLSFQDVNPSTRFTITGVMG